MAEVEAEGTIEILEDLRVGLLAEPAANSSLLEYSVDFDCFRLGFLFDLLDGLAGPFASAGLPDCLVPDLDLDLTESSESAGFALEFPVGLPLGVGDDFFCPDLSIFIRSINPDLNENRTN